MDNRPKAVVKRSAGTGFKSGDYIINIVNNYGYVGIYDYTLNPGDKFPGGVFGIRSVLNTGDGYLDDARNYRLATQEEIEAFLAKAVAEELRK